MTEQTDGCSFEDFLCQEAKMMLLNEAEATLTQLIRTRLKSDALRSIHKIPYDKIKDLLKTLQFIWGMRFSFKK